MTRLLQLRTVNVRGWSAAGMSSQEPMGSWSSELDIKLVTCTPLLIIMAQEFVDGLQFSCSSQLFQVMEVQGHP